MTGKTLSIVHCEINVVESYDSQSQSLYSILIMKFLSLLLIDIRVITVKFMI